MLLPKSKKIISILGSYAGLNVWKKPFQFCVGNVVANGTFDTDSDWTKELGVTISGGVANIGPCDMGVPVLTQSGVLTPAKTYKVTYTVLELTQGDVRARCGTTFADTLVTADGTYTDIVTCTTNGDFSLWSYSGYLKCKIDNVCVLEWT